MPITTPRTKRKAPAPPRRIRPAVTLTVEQLALDRLREVGAARPVPERNLSRLVGDAISYYLGNHWPPATGPKMTEK